MSGCSIWPVAAEQGTIGNALEITVDPEEHLLNPRYVSTSSNPRITSPSPSEIMDLLNPPIMTADSTKLLSTSLGHTVHLGGLGIEASVDSSLRQNACGQKRALPLL